MKEELQWSATGIHGQGFALHPELASSTFMFSRFSTEMAPVPSRVDHNLHPPIAERNDHAASERNSQITGSPWRSHISYLEVRF